MKKFKTDFENLISLKSTLSDIYSKTFIIENIEDVKDENEGIIDKSIIDKSIIDKSIKDDTTRKSILEVDDEYKTITNYKKDENKYIIAEINDSESELK